MCVMKKFYKNEKDGWMFGVCQGLGEHFEIDPMFFRFAFLLIPHITILYVVIAICAEDKPDETILP